MSLRTRLVLSFVLIIVLCLGIVAASLVVLLGDQINRMAIARLADTALPIYVQFRAAARGQVPFNQAWTNLQEMSEETGTYIFLLDAEGTVIKQATPKDSSWTPPSKFEIAQPTGNRPVPNRGIYTAPGGEAFIFVAQPVSGLFRPPNPPNPPDPETLVLAVPRSQALSIWADFAKPFLWAGLVALAVSILIAFFLARSVYIPVRRVTNAAEEIARGNYEQQVPVDGPQEVKGLAQSFNQMSKQVKHSQQMLRDFVADVSHELRSPLTSIKGFAQAIVDGTAKGKENQLKAATVIEDESKRMMRLVEELLEFSRLESGQITMVKEPVDLKELLQQCHEIFSMHAEEKGIKLKTEIEPLPSVVGDIDRLEQVFSNLLDNALKHTPSGGDIGITARHADPNFTEISITDTGPGIPAEQMRHVFERFYRADPKAGKAGAGLGLAIARQIVLAHGGDIIAKSTPGKGTEFMVRLPVQP
ncbi:MAG: HAMP domain-containing histidine kinase, partial [Dehalococcoidia bacterium]|nr:HAMP domain-containing histidine kinase [Dehalococcoidia bacterium]